MDRRSFLRNAVIAGAAVSAVGLDAEAAPAKVPRKVLGKTGEEVPILVLGCAQKFDKKYDKVLHRCFKEGVNYLDTALVYAGGQSHKTINPFLKQIGNRKDIWITSKAPHRWNRATAKSYSKDLDTCLKQLDTHYVDLFFMHGLDNAKYLEPEYLKMGDQMKAQKKIRFFGFSCHDGNVVELLNKAAKVGGIDAIMFRYNFGMYGNKELNDAIDNAKKANIGLIAMKTQRSVPKGQDEVVKFQSKKLTLGQAKLKAVWHDERIDSAVSHMDSVDLVKENVAAAKSPVKLTSVEWEQLYQLAHNTRAYACDGCKQHCESKVQGDLKIADTLRFLSYYECYGERTKAKSLFWKLARSQKEIDGVDLTEATAACPAGIDIRARLERARDVLT